MDATPVFFLVELPLRRRWLRRYAAGDQRSCSVCEHGYHQAMALVGDFPGGTVERPRFGRTYQAAPHPAEYDGDPRWPPSALCGYRFDPGDEWQVFERQLYRLPSGDLTTIADAPVGACWDAWWYGRKGPDGRSLVVKLPTGHEWMIDGRASNCTLPTDDHHRCWVRHGRPEDGTLHVDKNGLTCAAGAGSIVVPGWHGFLHNGRLKLA